MLTFADIEALKLNRIHESDILDYKRELIDDNSLLKHVSAFANTKGGFILFGVEETQRGGYPRSIPGINKNVINKERMEQIILSNIHPRLMVKIREVEHPDPEKSVLVLQIPDSPYKPHMNLRTGLYYKRYNFESVRMTEIEVCDAYRKRFKTYDEVNTYINKLIEGETEYDIFGQIIVIPTILDEQLIETYDKSKFSWLDPNLIDPQPSGFVYAPHYSYIPSLPKPSANGVICKKEYRGIYLEIHRNGCVEYAGDFSRRDDRYGRILFLDRIFCVRLLHTLQFANSVFLRYNYFGNVKIVTSLRGCGVRDAWLSTEPDTQPPEWRSSCSSNSIIVKREYASNMLETDFSFIAANIMNEIFNHFGKWKCPFFDDQGNYLENLLRKDP
mgnify:CR=1 FL=1